VIAKEFAPRWCEPCQKRFPVIWRGLTQTGRRSWKMSENKTTQHNFDEEIEGWSDFMKECYARAERDKKELSKKLGKEIEYLFLPNPESKICHNPEICPKPKYLFLGMEPGTPDGRTCFFPLFLHYCAYKYLCGENFNYYITDLAKGAMQPEYANETKKERYPVWLPLFAKELNLLGKPEIIAIGKTMYDGMINGFEDCSGKKHKFGRVQNWIRHYSKGAAFIFMKKEYENKKKYFPN
jgi:hypothetical protein